MNAPQAMELGPARASILLVDDHPANLLALEVVLEPLHQRVVRASSGAEALVRLGEEDFAVVLLDIMMPGLDGLATAKALRAQPRGRTVPIIFMTAGDTPAIAGYAGGAVDVLRKPLDPDAVRAKVAAFVELFAVRQQLSEQAALLAAQERAGRARITALLNASFDGIIGMDATGRITEFNGAAEAMFGRGREQVLGALLTDMLATSYRSSTVTTLASVAGSGEAHPLYRPLEVTALRADGMEFPMELAIRQVTTDGLPTFIGYARDLTAARQMERERVRSDRSRMFLAQASEAFAASLDYEMTLSTVVGLAVPHVADWCAVDIVASDSGEIVRLATSHADRRNGVAPEPLRRSDRPDPNATSGIASVLRTGRAELHGEISRATLERIAQNDEHLGLLTPLGLRSAIIVPIAVRAGILGAITWATGESGRRYDETDLATAQELARRAAAAIENARDYRAAQLAEVRSRFLGEATAALSSSLDLTATLARVARLAVPTIADSAAVYGLEEDGVIRLLALAARDPVWESAARELDTLLPLRIEQQDRTLPRVVQTGRAELLPDLSNSLRLAWSP
ncbi:MAG TPA: response regulator, partial [Polyangiaceae bacterium]|nr:response regulator [Polyangiaceae bacterium]